MYPRQLDFSRAPLASTKIEIVGLCLSGLVVYPGSHRRNWRAALDTARGLRSWDEGQLTNGDGDDEVGKEIMAASQVHGIPTTD